MSSKVHWNMLFQTFMIKIFEKISRSLDLEPYTFTIYFQVSFYSVFFYSWIYLQIVVQLTIFSINCGKRIDVFHRSLTNNLKNYVALVTRQFFTKLFEHFDKSFNWYENKYETCTIVSTNWALVTDWASSDSDIE